MTCPICGSADVRVVARPPGWTYLGCESCGVYYVDPMPEGDTVPDAGEFYDETYYSGERREREEEWEALSLEAARKRVSIAERVLGRKGSLLDVGCGTGRLLAAARERGWTVEGVDVSPSAVGYATRELGLAVRLGTLESVGYPDESFDCVWLSHVVEHVPDPISFLREVVRVLVPEGVAVVSVPNSQGLVFSATNVVHRLRGRYGKDKFACSLAPPGHLYAFNENSLRVALDAAGLVPRTILQSGKGDPVFFPVLTWKGAGTWPLAIRAAETLGRKAGRGSMLECFARKR